MNNHECNPPLLSPVLQVADSAHGGMVLMSEAAFTRLAVESLKERVMVLHMGEHRLREELPPTSIYCGCPRALMVRPGPGCGGGLR